MDLLEELARIYAERPDWVTGYISLRDARFLLSRALEGDGDLLVELGTASGMSTVALAYALRSGRLVTYDIDTHFYADRTKRVGDAARVMLSSEQLAGIEFRNPASALNLREDCGPDTIPFLFIDANHKHPWPTLDLLAVLPCLKVGAEVVMHDINLPEISPDFQTWGAKRLFDDLVAEKRLDEAAAIPNIGSVVIPPDKAAFRAHLVGILHRHPWETDAPEGLVEQLG